MRVTLSLSISLLLAVLTGCGGGGSSTPPPPAFTIHSGNWNFGATSANGPIFIIGGNVTQSGSNISETVRVVNSACFAATTPVPVSGSVSGQSATVTSAAIASQTISATLTGTANAINGSYNAINGSYSVTGTGCAGGDHGSLSGVLVPSITATWKGTFTSNGAGNPQVSVTAPISEGAATATGTFAVTGTAAYTGSPCVSTGTLTTASAMAGGVVDVVINNNDGSTIEFVGLLTNPAVPTQMTGTYTVTGGICGGDSGTGTLTKQ